MLFERVAESIEVLVAFREDRPEPVIFRWNNRHYQVRRVKTIHSEQTDIGKTFMFSVSDDRDIFHLSFRSDTMRWRLEERCALPVEVWIKILNAYKSGCFLSFLKKMKRDELEIKNIGDAIGLHGDVFGRSSREDLFQEILKKHSPTTWVRRMWKREKRV